MRNKVLLWTFATLFLIFVLIEKGNDGGLGFFVQAVKKDSGSTDYYKLFEMDRQTFDKTALRKSYYRLAKKFHPDKNPGNKEAEKKFKEITHAFEILNDDKKRQIYDVHGEAGLQGGHESDSGFNAQDIFERFFGGQGGHGGHGGFHFDFFGGHGGGRPRTSDVKVQFKVALQDVYKGAELKIDLNRQKICSVCKGHGTKDPNDVKVCSDCRGQGVKVVQKVIAPGFIQQFQTQCPTCSGRGKIFKSKCGICSGNKVRRQSESIKFKVPAGAPENFVIKLEKMADEIPDHDTGDIYIIIQSDEHKNFRRDGNNLHTSVEITLKDALFGFVKTMEHLDNHPLKLERTEVTQPEFVDEVPGEGMPIVDEDGDPTGRRGSLFVRYIVKLPKIVPTGSFKEELENILRPSAKYDEL